MESFTLRKLSESAAGDPCMECGESPSDYAYVGDASGKIGRELCTACAQNAEEIKVERR